MKRHLVLFGLAAILGVAAPAQLLQVGPNGFSCGTFGQSCGGHGFDVQHACSKAQHILFASELAGLPSGAPITSLVLNVSESLGHTWENLRISMSHTTVSDLTSLGFCSEFSGCPFGWLPTTVVRAPMNWIDAPGLNTFFFDTPFVWNGVDNVVVELEHSQAVADPQSLSSLGIEAYTDFATLKTLSARHITGSPNTSCPLTGPQKQTSLRPVFRLGYCPNAAAVVMAPGCSNGSGATPSLSGTPPYVGVVGTLTVANAPPFSGGVLFLGKLSPSPIGFPGGCGYHLTDDFIFQFFFTDATGQWSYSELIPNAPGLQADLQAIILPAGGAPLFQMTNALRLIIGC